VWNALAAHATGHPERSLIKSAFCDTGIDRIAVRQARIMVIPTTDRGRYSYANLASTPRLERNVGVPRTGIFDDRPGAVEPYLPLARPFRRILISCHR
jgi:hypothetical protein